MKITINKEIREKKQDEDFYMVGIRDKYVFQAIERKEMLEVELRNKGLSIIDPKMIRKNYKVEPYIGLFPNDPMYFYYIPIRLMDKTEEEKLKEKNLIMATM